MSEVTEDMVRNASGLEYWKLRYDRHHERVPGTGNKKISIQDKEYEKKVNFIIPEIKYNKNDVIVDYGCGIGRYAPYFHPKNYIGYDPVEKAVELAKERNPEHVCTSNLPEKADILLFFTVLQHIPVEKWNFLRIKGVKTIYLYENTSNFEDKNYIYFRSEDEYKRLIGGKIEQKKSHFIEYTNAKKEQITEKHTFIKICQGKRK